MADADRARATADRVIVLGVDPGTLVTGYGVVERSGRQLQLLDAGTICNSSAVPMPVRLREIYCGLKRVIDRFHPDEFAIESAFYGKNAQSALKLGQARGVALLAAVERDIPTSEYSPREVKRAVVGNGTASKEQVRFMIQNLLPLTTTSGKLDMTDAIAVAVCHLHRLSAPAARYKDWKSFIDAHPERLIR